MGSGSGGNAIYDIGMTGYPKNIGKVGFVNQDSKLSEYPADMLGPSKSFLPALPGVPQTMLGIDGNPFDFMSSESSIVSADSEDECKQKCSENPNCNSVYTANLGLFASSIGSIPDPKGKPVICVLSKSKLGDGPMVSNDQYPTIKTYFREPVIQNASSICPTNITPVDSISWNNYVNSGKKMTPQTDCTDGDLSMEDPQLKRYQDKLNSLSSQIDTKTKNLLSRRISVKQQRELNSVNVNNLASQYKNISLNIKKKMQELGGRVDEENPQEGFTNMNNIVEDSHLYVKYEYSQYILWSALAIVTIALVIRLLRKGG
jgi:hypothetical protein